MSVRLSDISKSFGANVILRHVTLEIQEGELFVLLGRSGSGKSTLLRLVAGLVLPDEGRVLLAHRDVTMLPPQEREVGFVFQNYSVFRHMTVAENVGFGLRIRGMGRAARQRKVDELLDLVGLSGLGSRYSSQLSGGQQQRVALARALAHGPRVMLLDEPFGALDAQIRSQMRRSLKEIQRRLGVTMVLVTHDQEEAFELADRLGIIDRGHLHEVGTPEDLYRRPRTEVAATFIGTGSVLAGRARAEGVELGGVCLPYPPGTPRHEEGAPARVLLRPESLSLRESPALLHEGETLLGEGLVSARLFSGAFERIRLDLAGLEGARPLALGSTYGHKELQLEVTRASGEASSKPVLPGQKVWVAVGSYHILDPTGLRILILAHAAEDGLEAAEYGCRLAEACAGPTTLLTLSAPGAALLEHSRRVLERCRNWVTSLRALETQACHESRLERVLGETSHAHHELVVLGASAFLGPLEAWPGRPLRRLMEEALTPVLVVREARPAIRRILICTAAGEPGKADVSLGGRLARRTGAEATVCHVARPGASDEQRARSASHLREAQATIEGLGVPCRLVEPEGDVLTQVLAQADDRDADLIVIGASGPRSRQQLLWDDMASRIVRATSRPVLVVPMPA